MGSKVSIDFSYTKEDMGKGVELSVHNDKLLWLNESFIRENFNKLIGKRKHEKIGCPFCKKGFLKLIITKPEYSDGGIPDALTLYRIGDSYTFNCSNETCGYTFFGISIHTHIN